MNPKIQKFDYPDTLVADAVHWIILVRSMQVTLKALVLDFHVRSRYAEEQGFDGHGFGDRGWPDDPDLEASATLKGEAFTQLVAPIRHGWPNPSIAHLARRRVIRSTGTGDPEA